MEGDKRVDELMKPVLAAITKYVKDSEAKTEIYNRVYEEMLNVVGVLDGIHHFSEKLEEEYNALSKLIGQLFEPISKAVFGEHDETQNCIDGLEVPWHWIPVDERLPEKGKPVIIEALIEGTFEMDGYYTGEGYCNGDVDNWNWAGGARVNGEVVAWMEFPSYQNHLPTPPENK